MSDRPFKRRCFEASHQLTAPGFNAVLMGFFDDCRRPEISRLCQNQWAGLGVLQITVGEEGFFVEGSAFEEFNPFGVPDNVTPGWAGRIGQVLVYLDTCRDRYAELL